MLTDKPVKPLLLFYAESTQDHQKPICVIHGYTIQGDFIYVCEAVQFKVPIIIHVTVGGGQHQNLTQQLVDYVRLSKGKKCIHINSVDSCTKRCNRLRVELGKELKEANVSVCVLHGDGNDTKNDCTQLDLTSTTG